MYQIVPLVPIQLWTNIGIRMYDTYTDEGMQQSISSIKRWDKHRSPHVLYRLHFKLNYHLLIVMSLFVCIGYVENYNMYVFIYLCLYYILLYALINWLCCVHFIKCSKFILNCNAINAFIFNSLRIHRKWFSFWFKKKIE